MNALYELRLRFGEDAQDIVASELDDDFLQLEQGGEVIIIPKNSAASFASAVGIWISSGGRAPSA